MPTPPLETPALTKGTADHDVNSKEREIRVQSFIKQMHDKLLPDELAKIDAVILFGSTARGEAKESSDVDVFALGQIPPALQMKLQTLLTDSLGNIDGSLMYGKSVKGAVGLITGDRGGARRPKWNILYATGPQKAEELERVLNEYLTYKKDKGRL